MSKPSVKVKEKEYSVSNIDLVLKLNSGPLIHLKLSEKLDGAESKISNEEAFKKEFFQDICNEVEGSFQWQGTTLKFILVGYNSSEARSFELVGLVVKKDLIDWFNLNNFKEKKQDYLIYQKSKDKNSWPFLNKVLGDKFKQPNQDFVEKIKFLFPENGCIWRYRDSNNFHFLNRAIAFASRHLPEVQGWSAFDDSDKPLRLILFEEKKQDQTIPKLDQTWTPSSYPFLPNRYSWNRWLDKSSTLTRELSIKEGQEIALIKKLVSHGSNNEDGQSFQAQNPTRLLFVPGTITIGDRNIFCHTVSYEFKLPVFGETEFPSVTMKIEVDYPERQIGDNEVVSLRLPGKFKEWEEKKDEETKVKIAPSQLKNWGIIDEKDQSLKSGDDGVLYTQILSPTYSDKKYSGIYIKHEKDDEMIVDIHPCGIPLVLGSVQKYRKELEEADITISGEKLAISVSEHHQSLDKSEAIILDNKQIKLNHGKKIFGQAQQKIDLLSQNIELGSSQVKINSAQTKINSLVNISFPSPKFPTPNIPSSSGIAGLASGKSTSTPSPQVPTSNVSSSPKGVDTANDKPLITIDNQNFEVGSARVENNLCLLDTFAQLANEYTNNNGNPDELKDIFKTFLADETGLIEIGSEQDFMDRNISENLLLTLSHENKENFEIQVYDQNPDGSITKYDKFTAKDKTTGKDQYPGKKPIVLQMMRTKTGEDQHHFVPLFPREQAVGDNHETVEKGLPAELRGGGKRSSMERPAFTDEAKKIKVKKGDDRRHVLGWDNFIKPNLEEGIKELVEKNNNDELKAKEKLMQLAESQGCTFNKISNKNLESVKKRIGRWLNSTPGNLNPEDAVENQAIETVRGQLLGAKEKLNEIAGKEGASEDPVIFMEAKDTIKKALSNSKVNDPGKQKRIKYANEIREEYRKMIDDVPVGDWQELTSLTGDLANTMGTDLSKKEGAVKQTKFALELEQQCRAKSGEERLKKLFTLREMPKEPNS